MPCERLLDEVEVVGQHGTDAKIIRISGEGSHERVKEQRVWRSLAKHNAHRFVSLRSQIRIERSPIKRRRTIIKVRDLNQVTTVAVLLHKAKYRVDNRPTFFWQES